MTPGGVYACGLHGTVDVFHPTKPIIPMNSKPIAEHIHGSPTCVREGGFFTQFCYLIRRFIGHPACIYSVVLMICFKVIHASLDLTDPHWLALGTA